MMEDSRSALTMSPLRVFLRFMWNPKKKTCMKRTFTSWLKLIIFYIIFFGVLIATFVGMLYVYKALVLDKIAPTIQRSEGPGLGFRPVVHSTSPLIWYSWGKGEDISYKNYVEALNKFFKGYEKKNVTISEIYIRNHKSNEMSLNYDLSQLGPCGVPNYGYDTNTPCIILKLNKIHKWIPDCYDSMTMPDNMPSRLQEVIEITSLNSSEKRVWVSCDGLNPADEEHMGEIQFYPDPSFKASFFPFSGQDDYHTPLIAVQFLNPSLGILTTVQCKAWAKNLKHETTSAEFLLMIGFKDYG